MRAYARTQGTHIYNRDRLTWKWKMLTNMTDSFENAQHICTRYEFNSIIN